jgi:hypothetical protein
MMKLPTHFFGEAQNAIWANSRETGIAACWISPAVMHGLYNAYTGRNTIKNDASYFVVYKFC